jgi:hypothetical protein
MAVVVCEADPALCGFSSGVVGLLGGNGHLQYGVNGVPEQSTLPFLSYDTVTLNCRFGGEL